MTDWPRDPFTGCVVLGAAAGRTTFEQTVARCDARRAELRGLRQRLGDLLVTHVDRLAEVVYPFDDLAVMAPVEPVMLDLLRAVDAFRAQLRKGS
jgi:hypothetical protein